MKDIKEMYQIKVYAGNNLELYIPPPPEGVFSPTIYVFRLCGKRLLGINRHQNSFLVSTFHDAS